MTHTECIAHLSPDGDKPAHGLAEHLQEVKKRAGASAEFFGSGDWASLAGLWHDLGKYNPEFQQYLQEAARQNAEDAHLEDVEGTPKKTRGPDHSTAGAEYAIRQLRESSMGEAGRILAYIIAGHHAGLADWDSAGVMAQGALGLRLNNKGAGCLAKAKDNVPKDILNVVPPHSRPPSQDGFALWIRMLFSCLVDADFLDTEAYMNGEKADKRGQYAKLSELKDKYHLHMGRMRKEDTAVNTLRAEILGQCLDKAKEAPGLFSLTVPTGGGKTLASLGFALEHAVRYNQRRIIYVIPYTSIIEQTSDVFRGVFGTDNVIEHHSQFDPEKAADDTTRQRLASENWDAPLIVTTTVQFFESLYAARTSRARKLHNITNSAVILDEAQLLPPELLDPIRHVMNELMRHYGVTFVLSTATQPVLDDPPLRKGAKQQIIFPDRCEIIADPKILYEKLKRVTVEYPRTAEDFQKRRSWEDLAPELATHERVLCIVSRRDDCRELHRLMPQDTIHLSALMCGEHRSEVIKDIKNRLQGDEPVRVISTQLVEAGVDLDFPVVYRAMAGLDSIAQAAGRCNREGKLKEGRVVVFVPPRDAPRGLLSKAENAAKEILLHIHDDPLQPDHFTLFFRKFYERLEGYDKYGILNNLKSNAELKFQFRTAAENFRMVEDHYLPVLVRYGKGAKIIERLLSRQGRDAFDRKLLRQAQRYSVTIPCKEHEELLKQEDIKPLDSLPGVYVQGDNKLYHSTLGFSPELSGEHGAMDLIG